MNSTDSAAAELRSLTPDLEILGFRSRGLLNPRFRDRQDLLNLAEGVDSPPKNDLEGFGGLVRDANAMRPAAVSELAEAMNRIKSQFEARDSDDLIPVTEMIEMLLKPYLEARVPLRRQGEGPSWACLLLVELLEIFDNTSFVVEELSTDRRKCKRASGSPATLSRLAVAAEWLAWSHLIVQPRLSKAFLNVAQELIDRLDKQIHASNGALDPLDRPWTATALNLESRLLRHLSTPPIFVH